MGSKGLVPVEVKWEDGSRQINECNYLFFDSIREIDELTLELIVTEGKLQDEILVPRNDTPVEQLRLRAKPIERDVTCRSFRLIFDRRRMVFYAVLNESYGKYPESPERFTGKLFRVFSRSHLLEYTKRTTYSSDEYPGVLHLA
jgi:hypothetical protein